MAMRNSRASGSLGGAMDISVIVPCLNEAVNLHALLRLLNTAAARCGGNVEVIVVDGGSTDGTVSDVPACEPGGRFSALRSVRALQTGPSRAGQMNAGARSAQYDLLYFVHADTRPPLGCLSDIERSVAAGAQLGGYATEFEGQNRLLRFNAWLTTFNVLSTRGGDQSLFTTRELFERLGGYRDMAVMEEYDLMRRAARTGHDFALLPGRTLVSDRKYAHRSWARVQVANIAAVAMWRAGRPSTQIAHAYTTLLGRSEVV